MIDIYAETTFAAADKMRDHGGSFVKTIGEAWFRADLFNKRKLCDTFENYFLDYGAIKNAVPENQRQEALQSEEFYNLMQAYRFAPMADQEAVTKAFHAVQTFLQSAHDTLLREYGEMRSQLRQNFRSHRGCSSQASLTSYVGLCDCGKEQVDRLLSSIPDRSVPPKV